MRPGSKIKLLLPHYWISHSCLLQDEGEDYEIMLENCSFHLRRAGIHPGRKKWRWFFFSFLSAFLVAFFWFPSDIHHILIKVWVSKVWVLSKFDQTLTFESLSFVKVWWNSDFKSLSFVKVWQNSDVQKSKFHQTLTKLRLSKVKVWSNFDKTQTFETQSLIKVWQNSDFWNSNFDQILVKINISFGFVSFFPKELLHFFSIWFQRHKISYKKGFWYVVYWKLHGDKDLLTRQAHHYG